MKFILASTLLLPATVHAFGAMDTCGDQRKCLSVTVAEIQSECESGSCEYEVCWRQLTGGVNNCEKWGDVEYLGDMHRYRDKTLHDGGCLNEENEDGKGYWDNDCQDPNQVYSSGTGWFTFFEKVCQIVPPGHTAHLLIYDGDSCDVPYADEGVTDQITSGNVKLPVYCSPSTQDLDMTNPGGQTYFPDPNDPDGGGTCSAKREGEECVWSVTVPSECSFEETLCTDGTGENPNSATVCDGTSNPGFDVLEYYENENNGPPPQPAIHDITLNGDGTVSFRAMNPYGQEFHDVYAVYPKPGDYSNWNEACAKEQSASQCTNDVVLTAQCLHADQKFTLVTVFVAGYTDQASAAVNINGNSEGNSIFACCPMDNEPLNQIQKSHVSAFTYLIHCGCGDENAFDFGDVPHRLLRVSTGTQEEVLASRDAINMAFHSGDLFDEELKELHGLN
mmetsp:Transcript_36842/g.89493  ORF Transcript_36842/g.89493 Transcript_36842/m.89493 type:complete len:448 (+) Transcript_36842:222-1565(+)|eukprot:CAMPEP_0113627404 /NCGR_PEP_ID=MMETSP0017_2-20120614/14192_1 /TAXON_ID=2856 /ORGANISM="Cylindrotheca closterium" /LENGTH=447 /DNA_ID=CAMNT_0000537657 /DNA_START=143 /DNA_END=1486 /DNA_ORIENTATION=- /assembly_acc=CAM_ASM_000147